VGNADLFASHYYAAGYYVYLWAEVLDAGNRTIEWALRLTSFYLCDPLITVTDGFEAFKETGNCFDEETAKKVRQFIYSSGSSIEHRTAYRAFRGRDPAIEPMLKKKGLLC
jgi:peptidyl-dipeptidase Dcp